MKNVTEIQVLGNDTVAFYNGTDIIMNVSQVIPNTSVYMTYGNNSITLILPSTTPFTFSVLPVTQIGPVTYTPLTGVEPQDQITARVLEIYTQLASTIFKGCCDCGSGTGGCTIEYQYNSDLSTGQWFYDSGTGKLQFNETSYLGQNFSGFYPVLPNNSWVFLVSDADPTLYAIFQVSNYGNMGTYIEYDATLIDGSSTFVVNTVFCVSLAAAGGSAIVSITAGNAGLSVSGSYPSFTISNDMTLTAGTNVTITGTYPNYIINSTGGGGGGSGTVTSIDVDGGTGISVSPVGPITTSGTFTVTNTAPDQVVALTAGTGINTSGTYPNFTITNTSPDQVVALTAGTGISTSGTYPNFTITNTSPDQTVSLGTTGTGLSVTGTYPSFTLENTLPDQTVVLSSGTGISVSGTYPSFTISSTVTGGIPHGTATGTDTYSVTIPGPTSYADGDAYLIRFTNGNTTGCTLDINGIGPITLYRNNDGALIGGDIVDGAEMLCIYNSTQNVFQTIGTAPNTLLGYVTNADSVTITKGQVVYAFGGQGDRMTVKLASNLSDSTSARTVGVVLSTSIASNQKGLIMMQGLLDGLSILPTATYSDGDPIYLGATAGSITKTKPYAPNHLVYVAIVTTANNGSSGRMYVNIQNGYELDELHNVQAQSPSLKDTLWYDNTVSPAQWKTASIGTILGYTPVPTTRTISTTSPLTGGGDLSADRTLSIPAATGSVNGYLTSTDWTAFNGKLGGSGTTNEIAYFTAGSTLGSLTTATYPSLTELSYVKGATSNIQTQINSLGGTYSAYTMKANNTASSATPSNFTFKDLGEQTLPVSVVWTGTAPTSGTLRYRWFQTGNIVHFHFIFTYTVAGVANTTMSFDHPSDMPIPSVFSGITSSVTFLFRYLSYIATTTNANPPTGWYGGLKRTATTPSTTYGWQFSGTSIAATSWSVSGTYYT